MTLDNILKLLPIVIMVESFMACVPYLFLKQWGQGLYWGAAGCLNLAVIFLIPKG
jgi:hypothetical protein